MVHCAYAFVLAFSSLYMALVSSSAEKKFLPFLNEKQKLLYENIRNERLNIYYKSLFLGFLFGLFYYTQINKDICYFLGIMLTFTSFFYKLAPKTTYLYKHMKTNTQHTALQDFHHEQKRNGLMSFAMALCIWIVVYLRN